MIVEHIGAMVTEHIMGLITEYMTMTFRYLIRIWRIKREDDIQDAPIMNKTILGTTADSY